MLQWSNVNFNKYKVKSEAAYFPFTTSEEGKNFLYWQNETNRILDLIPVIQGLYSMRLVPFRA